MPSVNKAHLIALLVCGVRLLLRVFTHNPLKRFPGASKAGEVFLYCESCAGMIYLNDEMEPININRDNATSEELDSYGFTLESFLKDGTLIVDEQKNILDEKLTLVEAGELPEWCAAADEMARLARSLDSDAEE